MVLHSSWQTNSAVLWEPQGLLPDHAAAMLSIQLDIKQFLLCALSQNKCCQHMWKNMILNLWIDCFTTFITTEHHEIWVIHLLKILSLRSHCLIKYIRFFDLHMHSISTNRKQSSRFFLCVSYYSVVTYNLYMVISQYYWRGAAYKLLYYTCSDGTIFGRQESYMKKMEKRWRKLDTPKDIQMYELYCTGDQTAQK